MQYYYGERNLLRALDEAEFWKHQEIEHTTVIQKIVPNLEQKYMQELMQFQNELSKTHAELVKLIESAVRSKGAFSNAKKLDMVDVIKKSLVESQKFVEFMQELIEYSEAVKPNEFAKTVLHHQIRESQYFIGIDELILG